MPRNFGRIQVLQQKEGSYYEVEESPCSEETTNEVFDFWESRAPGYLQRDTLKVDCINDSLLFVKGEAQVPSKYLNIIIRFYHCKEEQ